MNKTAIKNFAIWARNKLIADIKYKAGLMGITEKGIAGALPQSAGGTEFYDIGTSEPYCISGKEIEQRRRLKEVIENKAADTDYSTAYKYVIEEVAYTWFNRLIAVRFMEVNDYLPGHIRVLSSETGKMEPDLVTTPFDSELEFTSTEEERIIQLKQDNKIDELFRMLFIKQCNALNELLPALFEKTNDYTEILLNLSVIDQEGVVYHLVHDIPEEDFDVNRGGQVEIIGWLYQYYNTEPKNDAFAKKGKITKEEIPAVTQLFTPDWIVRYMVENSLGRLWLEGHPDDTLKDNWKYYLDEVEQEPEVQEKLNEIREEYKTLNPEDIKIIDPCMGSGHILVYAFDVLMEIYESVGWSQRDAAKSIVENNIYGLDIDDRAFQMAYFAIMMKARQYNRRVLTSDLQCHVYTVQESNGIMDVDIKSLGTSMEKEERTLAYNQLKQLLCIFKDAKEYGSLINVPKMDWDLLRRFVSIEFRNNEQISLDMYNNQTAVARLYDLVSMSECIANTYHVVVTNPPYFGVANGSSKLQKFVKDYYENGKEDLYTVFMMRCMKYTRKNAYLAMITQQTWMFLSRAEKLRKEMLNNSLVSMIHLGARAFDEIAGEVVQTTSFVFRKNNVDGYKGDYCKATSGNNEVEKEQIYLQKSEQYIFLQQRFGLIPGNIMAYWISDAYLRNFQEHQFSDDVEIRVGLDTGNNDYYLRCWYEIDKTLVNGSASCIEDVHSEKEIKYVPHTKGGSFRKWYGNYDYVIKFDSLHYSMLAESGNNLPSRQFYFKEGMSWTRVSSKFAVRYSPDGMVFNSACPTVFVDKKWLLYTLGLLNSSIVKYYSDLLSPTINFQAGDIGKIPYIRREDMLPNVDTLVHTILEISKADWDSMETSSGFVQNCLVRKDSTHSLISYEYKEWEAECEDRFNQLKVNEEELNRIFIDIYGLQDELAPEVEDKDVTVQKADLQRDIKSLLSYAVGCMFGRYSLDYEGLAYAGGTFDASKYSTFIPDVDGIIPITDEEYLEDDIVGLFCAWLKKVYGEETLEENLDFIAKALGKKGNSSREIIRNYFLTDFYKDHCSTYSVTGSGKRPIYWLFDSGKQNGFKALIYLHRYTPDTIGNLRVDYLHRMQRVYESEMNRMQDMIEHSTNSREVAAASKRKEKLQKQMKECREYDEKIGHLALDRIDLDLDDGVKYNYRKIQTGRDGKFYEVLADSKSIMMDAKKYADFKK